MEELTRVDATTGGGTGSMAKKVLNSSFYIMFICYIGLMLQVFFRLNAIAFVDLFGMRNVNLVPLDTIWGYLSGSIDVSLGVVLNNVLGNIIVFIPYGLYIQVLRKDKRWRTALLQVTMTSVFIELIQFTFNLGAIDIDDVLLNFLGGLIGICLYRLLLKAAKEEEKVKNIVALCSLVVGLPIMAIVCVLLLRNGIPIFI